MNVGKASEKIRDRVQKLLALSRNNPNEHEASAARAQAEKLIQEHGLAGGKKELPWKIEILKAVAAKHGCTIIEEPALRIRGPKAACAAVRVECDKRVAQYQSNQHASLDDLLAQIQSLFDPFAWVNANATQQRKSPTTKRKQKQKG